MVTPRRRRWRSWLAFGFGVAFAACSPLPATTPQPSASPAAVRLGDVLAEASQRIASQASSLEQWAGPPTGWPRARERGLVVFVAADGTNGGVLGAYEGVLEAATAMGWTVEVRDGKATPDGRAQALQAAINAKPIGIVLGGFDPSEQQALVRQAKDQGIAIVGWHAGTSVGPDPAGTLFANVSTRPSDVALLAADYVILASGGAAGVAIFTDGQYQIALDKADLMKAQLDRCGGCKVLAYRDTPIAESLAQMPRLVVDLRKQFGARLTYLLAINGNSFVGSRIGLREVDVGPTDPPYAVAAGDGDAAEFQRIRERQYQVASVAEPLYLQGWQVLDELNRALAGKPASDYVAPPGLITVDTLPAPGQAWNPTTAYTDTYRRLWGVAP